MEGGDPAAKKEGEDSTKDAKEKTKKVKISTKSATVLNQDWDATVEYEDVSSIEGEFSFEEEEISTKDGEVASKEEEDETKQKAATEPQEDYYMCPGTVCTCNDEPPTPPPPPPPLPADTCGRDEHGLVEHDRECVQFNYSHNVYPKPAAPPAEDLKAEDDDLLSLESEIAKLGVCTCGRVAAACTCARARYKTEDEDLCLCCKYPTYKCKCDFEQREAMRKWRTDRPIADAMPPVLEASHPLMEKFQETLRRFLEKENQIAQEEILNLTDELKLKRKKYDGDLAEIYRHDHDTNQQRILIEEYEQELAKLAQERQQQEALTSETLAKHKEIKEKLNQETIREREVLEEMEALSQLVRQLEEWRQETESDLAVSQRLSDKMRLERKEKADEKRQLDMIVFRLTNEKWKLESEMKMFEQQLKIKSEEAEVVSDRIATYNAELEDLGLEHKRLVSLWNSVLVNIGSRDKVYMAVRDDYNQLTENYRTLLSNLEVSKKATQAEMLHSQEIAMNKEKLQYDINAAMRQLEAEEHKYAEYSNQMMQLQEAEEMNIKDQDLVKGEIHQIEKVVRDERREYEKKLEQKMQIENDTLQVLQDCVLNDKATDAMAKAIRKLREMSKKQELTLVQMENSHAKIMLEIEMMKAKLKELELNEQEAQSKLEAREKEIKDLEDKVHANDMKVTQKQRDLDVVQKKYSALMQLFGERTPQELRVEELERQIAELRARTEALKQDWLRQQGHVVRLTKQYQRQLNDITLMRKQIQICEHALVRLEAEHETTRVARDSVDRSLRTLQGRLEVLERARRDHAESNKDTQRTNVALTHEYTANLKGLEADLIQSEEDITNYEKQKATLTVQLDRVQKEALVWQRKGILAVELKRNMHAAKSAAGEIFKMKAEIHKMTVRREQLKRISEKLATDLALCVVRRETVTEKVRASEALLKRGIGDSTAQATYKHKLRLAKDNVNRVTKDIEQNQDQLHVLAHEEKQLLHDIAIATERNKELEERIAELRLQTTRTDVQNHWVLERVVRGQRFGTELKALLKRMAYKHSRPESTIINEHEQAKSFCESMQRLVANIMAEYPYVEDKLRTVINSLNIEEPISTTPGDSPSFASVPCECESDEIVKKKQSMKHQKK